MGPGGSFHYYTIYNNNIARSHIYIDHAHPFFVIMSHLNYQRKYLRTEKGHALWININLRVFALLLEPGYEANPRLDLCEIVHMGAVYP